MPRRKRDEENEEPKITSAAEVTPEKRQQARRILDDTVIFKIKVRKPSFVVKLTKAEKEMLIRRDSEREKLGFALSGKIKPLLKPGKASKKAEKAEESAADENAAETKRDDQLALLRMSKELINLEAMRPIRALDAQFRTMLGYIELDTAIIGAGCHLIPLLYVNDIQTRTDEYIARRDELIAEFLPQLPALYREQHELDTDLYPLDKFPTEADVRESFSVEFEFKAEDVPSKLGKLSGAVLKREIDKAEVKWGGVGDEIRDGLRLGLAELIANATEQLGNDDGKPRVFRDSLVEKLNRFIETFPGRNLVNDEALEAMIVDLRGAMAGVTPETLRKEGDVRQKVLVAVEKAKDSLTKEGVIVGQRRRLRVREDDDE